MVLMADRLARAGGAGDQQVRHLGEVDDDRLAADGLAEAAAAPLVFSKSGRRASRAG
jgi:hypothetical protein